MTNEIITIDYYYAIGGKKPTLPFSAYYVLFKQSGEKFILADSFCEDYRALIKKHPHLQDVKILNEAVMSFSKQSGFTFSRKAHLFKSNGFATEKEIVKKMFMKNA